MHNVNFSKIEMFFLFKSESIGRFHAVREFLGEAFQEPSRERYD